MPITLLNIEITFFFLFHLLFFFCFLKGHVYEGEKKRREAQLRKNGTGGPSTFVLEQGSVKGARWMNKRRNPSWALVVADSKDNKPRRQGLLLPTSIFFFSFSLFLFFFLLILVLQQYRSI